MKTIQLMLYMEVITVVPRTTWST